MTRRQNLTEDRLQGMVTARLLDDSAEISCLRSEGVHGGEDPRADFLQVDRFLGKLRGPWDRRGAAVEFAVDEIRATPEEQTDRRDDRDVISEPEPRDAVLARIKKCPQG